MLKILFITPNLSSGGAERQLVTLARSLKTQGMQVEVLCYGKGDFYGHLLEEENIPVHWYILDNYFLRVVKVRQIIRNGKFSEVISFLDTANFLNNFSAMGGKKWRVITGERSSNERTFSTTKGKIFGWFQRFSDVIVCNSNNAKRLWLSHYPRYRNKLTTIYNIVKLPRINTEYIPKKDGRIHIIVIATYRYSKNPIGVIKALSLLNEEEKKKIKIDWYGRTEFAKGNTRAYYEAKAMVDLYKLDNVISLNESSKDIFELINQADFVGLFSQFEGLPNAICEGMMIGKPIIMTKVSDYDRLVDETNGFLCDWDDPESIRNSFRAAINTGQERLIEMGKSSLAKAKLLFSEEDIIKQWLSIL